MPNWKTPLEKITVGTGRKVSAGENLAILTLGHVGNFAVQAKEELEAEGLNPSIYDMRFVKPLDEKLLHEIFQNHDFLLTVEDGCLMGGFGSAILEFMADNNYTSKMVRLGIPDEIIEHGEQSELHAECGYDKAAIAAAVRKMLVTTAHV